MIYLHTGQPGAGKSLYTLTHVRARAEKESRPVYYSGIKDCMVPGWIELEDATQWASLPAGALIIIDEAQRIFRPRHVGSNVPEYVAALETHRHNGFDIYVVTQHPNLVEANVRRLVGTHRHIMRAFGSKAAIVHEWNEVRTDCDTKREGSITHTFAYPKEAFALYKSAEVHTHKARVPLRVWLVMLSPLILGGIGYGLYKWISMRTGADAAQSVAKISGVPVSGAPGQPGRGQVLKLPEWAALREPRLVGLAYTAPAYDEVTKPAVAPYPAICVKSAERCRCYSQQATRLDVRPEMCAQIVEKGFFKDWRDADAVRPDAPKAPEASAAGLSGPLPASHPPAVVPASGAVTAGVTGPLDAQAGRWIMR